MYQRPERPEAPRLWIMECWQPVLKKWVAVGIPVPQENALAGLEYAIKEAIERKYTRMYRVVRA